MRKLLLATNNQGKLREYKALLDGLPFDLRTLREEGINIEVEEQGSSMEENARHKALAYAQMSGLLTLADDSGLEVDALGGEPGPLSARYAGEGVSNEERIAYLLKKLKGVPTERRTARFRCVVAIATPQGRVEVCEATCAGTIAEEPRGEGGFGYDPIFHLPEMGRRMAELTLEEKNQVSHRGKAARAARKLLEALAQGNS